MKLYGKGYVEKRGKNKWRLRVVIGYNTKHQPIYKSKTITASSKEEAYTELGNWKDALRLQSGDVDLGKITVDVAFNLWIESLIKAREDEDSRIQQQSDLAYDALAPRTIASYKEIVDARIVPMIGSIPIIDLTASDLSDMYHHLRYHGNASGGSLSACTLKKVAAVVNLGMKYCIQKKWLRANPNTDAKKYTGKRGDPAKSRQVKLPADAMKIIVERAKICPNRGLGTAIMLAACCGLRRAEACGLRWQDVNLEDELLHIQNDMYIIPAEFRKDNNGETCKLGPTKTGESFRTLPIIPILSTYLKKIREEQVEKAAYFGEKPTDLDFVVTNKKRVSNEPRYNHNRN